MCVPLLLLLAARSAAGRAGHAGMPQAELAHFHGSSRMDRSNLTARATTHALAQESTPKMGDAASASETATGTALLCPGELPGKREMKQWLDVAIPTLLTGDASLVYEGLAPSSFAGLQLRKRVAVTDAGTDKTLQYRIQSDNRKIDEHNDEVTLKRTAELQQIELRVGNALGLLMAPKAPVWLAKLQRAHSIGTYSAMSIHHPCNGIDMIKALHAELLATDRETIDREKIGDRFREMMAPTFVLGMYAGTEDTPESFLKLTNEMSLDLIPYLESPPSDAELAKTYLRWLPPSIGADVRRTEAELKQEGKSADLTVTIEKVTALLTKVQSGERRVAMIAAPIAQQAALVASVARAEKAAVDSATAAAAAASQPSSRRKRGGDAAKAAEAAAAAATAAKSQGKKATERKERAWCSSDSCQLDHDTRAPGQPCWSDSQWEGPLPQIVSSSGRAIDGGMVERLLDRRVAHAAKKKLTLKKLQVARNLEIPPAYEKHVTRVSSVPVQMVADANPAASQAAKAQATASAGGMYMVAPSTRVLHGHVPVTGDANMYCQLDDMLSQDGEGEDDDDDDDDDYSPTPPNERPPTELRRNRPPFYGDDINESAADRRQRRGPPPLQPGRMQFERVQVENVRVPYAVCGGALEGVYHLSPAELPMLIQQAGPEAAIFGPGSNIQSDSNAAVIIAMHAAHRRTGASPVIGNLLGIQIGWPEHPCTAEHRGMYEVIMRDHSAVEARSGFLPTYVGHGLFDRHPLDPYVPEPDWFERHEADDEPSTPVPHPFVRHGPVEPVEPVACSSVPFGLPVAAPPTLDELSPASPLHDIVAARDAHSSPLVNSVSMQVGGRNNRTKVMIIADLRQAATSVDAVDVPVDGWPISVEGLQGVAVLAAAASKDSSVASPGINDARTPSPPPPANAALQLLGQRDSTSRSALRDAARRLYGLSYLDGTTARGQVHGGRQAPPSFVNKKTGTKSHHFRDRVSNELLASQACGKVAMYVREHVGTGPYEDVRSTHPIQDGGDPLGRDLASALTALRVVMSSILSDCADDGVSEDSTILAIANLTTDDFRWAQRAAIEHPYTRAYGVVMQRETWRAISYSATIVILAMVVALCGSFIPVGHVLMTIVRGPLDVHKSLALSIRPPAPPAPSGLLPSPSGQGGFGLDGADLFIVMLLMAVTIGVFSLLQRAVRSVGGVAQLAARGARALGHLRIQEAVALLAVAACVSLAYCMPASVASGLTIDSSRALDAHIASMAHSAPAASSWADASLNSALFASANVVRARTLDNHSAHHLALQYDATVAASAARPTAKAFNASAFDAPGAKFAAAALNIYDSGACVDIGCSKKYAVAGSWKTNNISVDTANGLVTPQWSFTADIPLPLEGGGTKILRRKEVLFMAGQCSHNLISGTKLSAEGFGVWLAREGEQSYILHPDGARTPLHMSGVAIIPDTEAALACSITQGASARSSHLDSRGVHNRYNHSSETVLRMMPQACADAPDEWSKLVLDDCENCLESTSDKIHSSRHAKEVNEPGHFSFDTYSLGVPHVNGGHKYIWGAVDRYSKLFWVRLMKKKSEAGDALREYETFLKAHGVTPKSGHADNATEFVGENTSVQAWFRERSLPFTTAVEYEPRGNGVCERRWRMLGRWMREALNCSKLPRNYAGHAAAHCTWVSWRIPDRRTGKTPWELFTGDKPECMTVRPFGCLCYPKIIHPITKVADQSMPCIHLTRSQRQPGYVCLEPLSKKVFVSTHVRFCESEFTGLETTPENYERVAPPTFSMEHVKRVADGTYVPTVTDPTGGNLVDDGEDAPPLIDLDSDSDDDELTGPGPGARHVPTGPVSKRLPPRSSGSRYMQRNAASAFSLSLPQRPFVLYLCSGARRENDLTSAVSDRSTLDVLTVDMAIGGYEHDLTRDSVAAQVLALAAHPNCRALVATPPCNTWSALRFRRPGPPVLRDLTHPRGIPDASGQIPAAAALANNVLNVCLAAAVSVRNNGGSYLFENPVSRARGSPWAIDGREGHAAIWDMPEVLDFVDKQGAEYVYFDQCRLGAPTRKTTALLVSPDLYKGARDTFGPLVCNHSHTPDETLAANTDEAFRSEAASAFTPAMNAAIADVLLNGRETPTEPDWMSRIGSQIDANSTVARDHLDLPDLPADITARETLAALQSAAANHLDDRDVRALLRDVCPIAAGVARVAHDATFVGFVHYASAFKVAKARKGDTDNPQYRQAMNGNEREFWLDACDNEMDNLSRHGAYIEVPEDSLSTYDVRKGHATEVVNTLWVLKKKYNQLRELLKGKARCVLDGSDQKRTAAELDLTLETFSPAGRHTTLKCLAACACARPSNGKNVRRTRTADVEAAYLQGELEGNVIYARPPPGYRSYDRRGVPIVWKLTAPLYGEADAGRLWNRTFHRQIMSMSFKQSDYDPCYYYKVYEDDTRLDVFVFVDDLWLEDDAGSLADADLKVLCERFKMTISNPEFYLGLNVHVDIENSTIAFTSQAYIESMADKYLPNWREQKAPSVPSDSGVRKLYEEAQNARLDGREIDKAVLESFGGKVGAIMYAAPGVRADINQTVSLLSRALTFPTPELEQCVDKLLLYMAHTSSLGITYDGRAPDASLLKARSDSDWAVGHSTTGWHHNVAGAAVGHASEAPALHHHVLVRGRKSSLHRRVPSRSCMSAV